MSSTSRPTRRIAVVVSGWPRLSESFALNELLAMQRAGMLAIVNSIVTLAGVLAPLVMGSIIQHAATPLAGYERGYVILGALMVAGGVIGLLFIRPEADRKRLAARAVPSLPLSPARA